MSKPLTPTNVAIVFTDATTGRAYAMQLDGNDAMLALAMTQHVKAQEIAPFILRGVNVSEERARRIIEKQQGLHLAAGNGVESLERMAKLMTEPPEWLAESSAELAREGRTTIGVTHYKGGVQQIPKPQPVRNDVDEMQYATCWRCGQRTAQHARYGDEDNPDALTYHCKACDAEQCERVRCVNCGKVSTNPQEGAHYCTANNDQRFKK